ncbi:MAG: hypothetical protein A3C08_00425 [Candidatus Taylorbacteria bacterium RIFCSPHIGHO2_02_FULL_47_18]|uniref:Uncharacterized protein n=1 Tax=Candidatus Taylorbacteria bacterium RIFCSPLOWO2_01_FULL_48_100 TaxID=1802322 RepID=A0A1G2NCU4_9BACT|nr:MAG: hypothetical protein A2670_00140 [Candidatus Taylorbacteria bacterium RIFCSPHIGHO2_01_FULL_48_38]OHA27826.1 MAG: hypothetical protein A3C08_00425 [Candidatus Taylorbacteria bacterium RIFCSPHIGHO2_02_FULL_47_18]OHA33938.1 MAG: hypothetical protein A2938_02865 [Candidatus Taylorbacteria bacterium RIFCSPLOWO2_01_FULL_48_100]OHA40912.1 MAG: hypothetical protein A3J31_03870 [Candidatus Taylorbacteria bacterium RIFCSPLOWO2_02_FULL_48_16]OHA45077.1 MAG: hypothetical protein A3H13_02705 [Candid
MHIAHHKQTMGETLKTVRKKSVACFKKSEIITLYMPIEWAKTKCVICNKRQDVDGRCPCVNKDAW